MTSNSLPGDAQLEVLIDRIAVVRPLHSSIPWMFAEIRVLPAMLPPRFP